MNKKFTSLLAAVLICGGFLAACQRDSGAATPPVEETPPAAVTGASLANDPAVLVEAAKGDFWIITSDKDVKLENDVVFSGDFMGNPARPAEAPYRKLAFYDQDADKIVTAVHTLDLNGHNMTVESPGFKVSNTIIKGDVFVDADGFTLENSIIEGNLTFATEEQKASANLANDNDKGMQTSSVTGEVTVK
jgi:hypothetical protein